MKKAKKEEEILEEETERKSGRGKEREREWVEVHCGLNGVCVCLG